MTDQELLERMQEWWEYDHGYLIVKAADRIEELVKEQARLHAGWHEANVRALDAGLKLAKAVEALRETTQMLSQCTFTIIRMKGQYFERHEVVDKAHAVLAELEGKG